MKVRNVLIKGRDFLTMLTAAALVVCLVSGCGSSAGTHADITRLDDEGYLYYMDYSKDYYYNKYIELYNYRSGMEGSANVYARITDYINNYDEYILQLLQLKQHLI